MNGLNAILDFWFVLGLGWGVEGVAWATFIAEWFAFFVGLGICFIISKNLPKIIWSIVFSRTKILSILLVNRDIFLRSLMLEMIFVSFLMTSGKFGDVELAATQILLQFLHISAYGMDGFAFAAEVLVGQAVGKSNRIMLRDAVIKAGLWTFIIAVFMSIIYALLGPLFIRIMTTSDEVRLVSETFLIFIVIGPILGALPFLMDGIFVGATRSVDMRNMMFLSLIIYALAAYVLVGLYGFYGLWVALLVSFIVRGLSLLSKYPRLEKSII
jgi:MATE family multidrug resistance protein